MPHLILARASESFWLICLTLARKYVKEIMRPDFINMALRKEMTGHCVLHTDHNVRHFLCGYLRTGMFSGHGAGE